jgi:hypothetical protein
VNRFAIAATLALATTLLSGPARADDVNIAVAVGLPGFYGQLNIGDVPRPRVIYARPVVIERAPEFVAAPPIYLRVPPGHEKHWSKHCAAYQACGRPVYFVREEWYRNEYVPRHREYGEDRGEDRHEGREHDHGKGHDHDHGNKDD